MSRAIAPALAESFPGSSFSQRASSEISMAPTCEISLPSMRKYEASALRRVPWQTGQTILSSMSSTSPSQVTISAWEPSPMRKNSSEPNISSESSPSGSSDTGSYTEKPCLRAMARTVSDLRLLLRGPRGSMAPSAMLRLRSGTMVSKFTSGTTPRPLQCGQ